MFIKKNFYFWILIMFLLLNSNNFAQDTLIYRHYNFGFGVTLLKDYTFYFPIFITNNIKMEPELYYRRDSDPYHDIESTELEIGTGLFYSRQYSQLNIYSGLRAVYSFYNSWEKYEGIELGPTLGGEYFLAARFSLGTEMQLIYSHHRYSSRNDRQVPIKGNTRSGIWTYAYFIMRIYLF